MNDQNASVIHVREGENREFNEGIIYAYSGSRVFGTGTAVIHAFPGAEVGTANGGKVIDYGCDHVHQSHPYAWVSHTELPADYDDGKPKPPSLRPPLLALRPPLSAERMRSAGDKSRQ
jgi:hypothetical protein